MKFIVANSLSFLARLSFCTRRTLFINRSGWQMLMLLLLGCALASNAAAQNVQFTQGSVGSGLDNSISIPLGGYPGRGSASLPINISYSSRVWRIGHLNAVYETIPGYSSQVRRSVAEAIYGEYSTSGWKSSLDIPRIEWPKADDLYWYTGKPYSGDVYPYTFRIARVFIHMPDGSTHQLRKSDQPYRGAIDMQGTFYAVDGSRLRYDSTGESTGTLYLPDGTRYILNSDNVKYIDRHGNTLNYDISARQWTDTLGRTIDAALPSTPYVGDIPYSLPGINGTQPPPPYIFRWRRLADVLAQNSQGQTPVLMNLSSHYLPNPGAMPTNQGGTNFPQPASGDSLFHSDYPDEEAMGVSSYTYVVGRGQASGQVFNPVVLAEIELPNHLRYQFGYNNYGEITKVTYPTGAHELYEMGAIGSLAHLVPPYTEASRGVTKRMLSADGSGQDYAVWEYFGGGAIITTKAPDGTSTDTYRFNVNPGTNGNYWPFGLEDERQGMIREERIYAPNPNPSGPQDFRGPMLRRKLTNWVATQFSILPRSDPYGNMTGNNTVYYQRSARPDKEVNLILDTGGNALAKTMTYGYDLTYQATTGIDLTVSTESTFSSVNQTTAQTDTINNISPGPGTVISSAQTAYLNDAAYRNRNILGLATSVVLQNAAGQAVSRTEKFFDEAAYPLLTYADLSNVPHYTDPATTARGNVTTVRRYTDIGANLYLEAHSQFDQSGNVRKTINERGFESEVEYSALYKRAYATQTTSVAPDANGLQGSATAFTTSSVFDPTTGLMLSTTDVNGQITTFSYKDEQNVVDPLNRLRKVTRPDGGWTSYFFNDAVGNLYTLTQSQFEAARVTKSYQFFDAMGRASRSFALESGTTYLVSDVQYEETMGRVWRTSNPYRAQGLDAAINPTERWTTNEYDALGRVKTVTLPDATFIQNTYQGVYTTVKDQAENSRRQQTDALGRIVRVDEPDASGDLGEVDSPKQATTYEYNTQGNIVHVQQAAGANIQHRYFKYDAIGRLTYEFQVEPKVAPFTTPDANTPANPTGNTSWTRKIVYDENGYQGLPTSMLDARNILTQYSYDKLNRITQITYSDGTPTLKNYYDLTRFTVSDDSRTIYNRGRLAEVTTDAAGIVPLTSQAYNYDLMGRVANNRQTVGTSPFTMVYQYNVGGALKSEKYPSGRVVNYDFDDAARLSQVTSNSTAYASQFDYSSTEGLLKSVAFGNGTVQGFEYNNRLQLKTLSLTKNNNVLQKYEYKYGKVNTGGSVDETKNNGQIGRIEGYIGTQKQWQQRFGYDSLSRLSEASEYRGDNSQRSYLIDYDYDRFGNRYQKFADNQNNPLSYVPVEDADISKTNNRFLSGVTYDDAGNVTADDKFRDRQYHYDANGRQKWAALLDGSGAATSVYDGAGQRVATIAGAVTNVMVYDVAGKLVAEYGTGTTGAGGTQYAFADHQGTPRVMTGGSDGQVISRQDYQAFGEELGAVGMRSADASYGGGSSARQKYAAMEKDDASGMSHTLWRKYDAMSGRWTSPDPYGGSMTIADPQSFNRYSYVNNDPVTKVDPLGLMLSDIGVYQTDNPAEARYLEKNATWLTLRSVAADQLNYILTEPINIPLPSASGSSEGGGGEAALGHAGTQQQQHSPDVCGDMAQVAQNEADTFLAKLSTGARTGVESSAMRKERDDAVLAFDDAFSERYVGRPLRTQDDVNNLRNDGPIDRTMPSYYWGQSGFQKRFWESKTKGPNDADQTHHFVAMFSGGINGRYWTTTAHNAFDNRGDIRLTNAAYDIGARMRGNPLYMLRNIGNIIRTQICDPNRNPKH